MTEAIQQATIRPEFIPADPPRFVSSQIIPIGDASAYECAQAVDRNLSHMKDYVADFNRALALSDHCRRLSQTNFAALSSDWVRIAMKQGVLDIYNFSKALDRSKKLIRQTRSWLHVDNKLIERAHSDLRESFPSLRELRQTVMHQGENHGSEERYQENTMTGDFQGGGITVIGCTNTIIKSISDDTYYATFAGKVHSYDLTTHSALKLVDIANTFFDGFRAAQAEK